jgi:hypothetical protein
MMSAIPDSTSSRWVTGAPSSRNGSRSSASTCTSGRKTTSAIATICHEIRVSLSGSPAPKWGASTGAFYQLSDYKDPDPQLGVTRRDSYYGLDLAVSYTLRRNLSLRAEFLLSRNDSNIELFQYDRNLIALKLRYELN